MTRFDGHPFPLQLQQPRATLVCTPAFPVKIVWHERTRLEFLPVEFVETGCVCGRRTEGCACSFLAGAPLGKDEPPTAHVRGMGEAFVVEGELDKKRKRRKVQRFGASSSSSSPPPRVTLTAPVLASQAETCHRAGATCAKGRVVLCPATGHWWCRTHWRTRVVSNNGRTRRTTLAASLTITLSFWNPFILHRAHGLETNEEKADEDDESEQDERQHGDLSSLGVCARCESALEGPTRWDAFEQRWLCFRHFSEQFPSE